MTIKETLHAKRLLVDQALQNLLPDQPGLLHKHFEAMRYSLFADGKRIRPVLCMLAAETLGADLAGIMAIPCALECIHTYSLIHDDLPAMDDDDLRRGKPTNHVVFGEAQAILAGDGLLTLAFDFLSRPDLTQQLAERELLRIIQVIARASGAHGMVGGQSLDVDAEGKQVDFDTLRNIHRCKTGALITASVQAGAIIGKASAEQFAALSGYGQHLGLAFQITDDLLNVEGDPAELGKAAGSDAERLKATYPAFFGVEGTRQKAEEAVSTAINAVADFGEAAATLRDLAWYVLNRRK